MKRWPSLKRHFLAFTCALSLPFVAMRALADAPVVIPPALRNGTDPLKPEAPILKTLFVPDSSGVAVPVGSYLQYLPQLITTTKVTIVVLVHGTPDPGDPEHDPPIPSRDPTGEQAARESFCDGFGFPFKLAQQWKDWADHNQLMLVCPLFSQADYGSIRGAPLAGYRGMLGRHNRGLPPRTTDPDGFVNALVDQYQKAYPGVFDTRIFIVGHSAGAQFVSRYLVVHPNRIAATVLSSSGSFSVPDPTIAWPNGPEGLTIPELAWPGTAPTRYYWLRPLWWNYVIAAKSAVQVAFGECEQEHPPTTCPCLRVGTPPQDKCFHWHAETSEHYDGILGMGENYIQDMRDNAWLSAADPGMVLSIAEDDEHYAQNGTSKQTEFLSSQIGCRSFTNTLATHLTQHRAIKVGNEYFESHDTVQGDPLGMSDSTVVELFENAPHVFDNAKNCSWVPNRPTASIWNDTLSTRLINSLLLSQ